MSELNNIETMVLMASYADSPQNFAIDGATLTYRSSKGESNIRYKEQADSVMKKLVPNRMPSKSYTFDLADKDRLFAGSSDMLIDSPIEIIGDGIEVLILNGLELKWYRIEPMSRKTSRLVSTFGGIHKFVLHERLGNIKTGQWGSYRKGVGAFNKNYDPAPTSISGQIEPMSTVESITAIIACSIVEDANRPNSIKAEVHVDSSVIFPISIEAYQDALKIREAPLTKAGRKNPILHWVGAHERKYKSGKTVEVSQFKRGVEKITVDGMDLLLTMNERRQIKSQNASTKRTKTC